MLTELQNLSKHFSTPSSLKSAPTSSRWNVKSWKSTSSTSYDPLFTEEARKPEDVKGWPTEAAPLKKSGCDLVPNCLRRSHRPHDTGCCDMAS
ncbi:predicted protein [Uncinocarpus reesii 1704]|uniref:Uncharacterized protein n=1 Tax=Uncinocarpus reesii (strain UAMH 1704) TaxID=336963 RepID=C4JD91_UNCRE|nr:uncharacterized protein UREG_00298 [Uncinocarpus reesii 1704]EEP75452.1 predicted protein [Uncinocarpus reesii 1704]